MWSAPDRESLAICAGGRRTRTCKTRLLPSAAPGVRTGQLPTLGCNDDTELPHHGTQAVLDKQGTYSPLLPASPSRRPATATTSSTVGGTLCEEAPERGPSPLA